MGALNGALNGVSGAEWIDSVFWDQSGFLKQYEPVVKKLLIRDREVEIWKEKALSEAQAQNIAEPSKPAIAKQHNISLATVQNVHRIMRETRKILEAA